MFVNIGDQDPLVQIKWARLTEQGMRAMGFKDYSFREYRNMGHASSDRVNIVLSMNEQFIGLRLFFFSQEMKDVNSFLIENLPRLN